MRRLLVLALFTYSSLLESSGVLANDLHYSLFRTWALAPPESEDRFKIIGFLPESYLFQVLERDSEEVSGNFYSRVLTQDAVELLLYSQAISDKPFRKAVGSHEIIFNSRYALCRVPACNKSNSQAVHQVARGEAFKITEPNPEYSQIIEISATRGDQLIRGYLRQTELENAMMKGAITRTDRQLPRYRINKHKSDLLSTGCNEKLDKWQELMIPEQDRWSPQILELLDMGAVDEVVAQLRQSFGAEGFAYNFYLYEVEDLSWEVNSPERFFRLAAGYKTSCTQPGESLYYSEQFIEHVLFVNSRNQFNGKPILVEIPAHLFNTPRNIREFTGDAYMISINKPEHFEQAIEILADKIGDRTLAGYILTELNRSCRSDMRKQYSGSVCRIYDY